MPWVESGGSRGSTMAQGLRGARRGDARAFAVLALPSCEIGGCPGGPFAGARGVWLRVPSPPRAFPAPLSSTAQVPASPRNPKERLRERVTQGKGDIDLLVGNGVISHCPRAPKENSFARSGGTTSL